MADEIRRLRPEDFDELVAHLARCFNHPPESGFERRMSGLYARNPAKIANLLSLRRGGRLAAVVGLFPLRWRMGDELLITGGIGGVSVAPEFRGQGLMQRLMHHALGLMREQGMPLSFLRGQRQRYGYFGYEIAGHTYDFAVSRSSLRHVVGSEPAGLSAADAGEPDFGAMHRLQAAQPAYCERPAEDFPRLLTQWNRRCLVLRRASEIVGYAVVGDGRIHELVLADSGDVPAAGSAVMAAMEAELIQVPALPTDPGLAVAVERVSQSTMVLPSGNWLVLDWPRVLTALLRARLRSLGPADGEAVLRIGGRALALRARGLEAICEESRREPTLALEERAAIRLLFGPMPPTFGRCLPADATDLARWCPLPLAIARSDYV